MDGGRGAAFDATRKESQTSGPVGGAANQLLAPSPPGKSARRNEEEGAEVEDGEEKRSVHAMAASV